MTDLRPATDHPVLEAKAGVAVIARGSSLGPLPTPVVAACAVASFSESSH